MFPRGHRGTSTTSASVSRHVTSLLWCSYSPTNTTGRSWSGRDARTLSRCMEGTLSPRMSCMRRTGRCAAGPAEHQLARFVAAQLPLDVLGGLVGRVGAVRARGAVLGVRVCVQRQRQGRHAVFHAAQCPAARHVIGVGHAPLPEGGGDDGVGPDQVGPQGRKVRAQIVVSSPLRQPPAWAPPRDPRTVARPPRRYTAQL